MKEQAGPSGSGLEEKERDDRMFECNICLDTAKDAVVSMCGHLFWYVICYDSFDRTSAFESLTIRLNRLYLFRMYIRIVQYIYLLLYYI